MKKIIIALLAIIAFAGGYLIYYNSLPIANVNGEKITVYEFKKALGATDKKIQGVKNQKINGKTFEEIYKEQLLNNMINEKLMLNKALKEGIKGKNDADIINKLIAKETSYVGVSDDEIKKYYEQHKNDYIYADIYRIDLKDEKDADNVLNMLNEGSNFSDLAKKYSIDTATKDNGGFVGNLSLSQYSATINYTLTTNGVTKVKLMSGIYEIVKVDNVGTKSLDNVKDSIRETLLEVKRQNALKDFTDSLRKNAKISVNNLLLNNVK
ncbi:peptidylprolyl isomerase [Thermoanaerobacterium butyriciformans]|uniref:peptidylprolyl isomerase n=1 Tax=Thermoanaerobacterium butyriciformans TaxID=1702242 RepID=A0ABS4NCW9_9THEO|nr:SurA N-terminal domain-containing protein [Thermoanaerobacterium butyriciformans]MBP2070825.1 foldase protein PrsA [Thermoanaerobacterium butyriciformans]